MGYGYASYKMVDQLMRTDLVAWVKPLSVEPSFKESTSRSTDPTYYPYVNITFSVIESLWGSPASDTIVVEYPLSKKYGEVAHAIERAKEWVIARQSEWWQSDEAIVFLSEIRHLGWGENGTGTGAQYIIATGEECWKYGSCSSWWDIDYHDQESIWAWLPMVTQVATSEKPYSEPVFRVRVTPYGATRFEYITAVATLSNIKSIVQALTSKGSLPRGEYYNRVRRLWEQNKNKLDNYSFVFWQTNTAGESTHPIKVVVRNGEAVEGVYATAFEKDGVVYPAGSKVDENYQTLPTLESSFWGWGLALHWLGTTPGREDDGTPIVSMKFDYEYGYPSVAVIAFGEEYVTGFHASDYTPLEE